MKIKVHNILLVLFLFVGVLQSNGQFYNGHQMTFGKNRVQYNDFYWQYYRFPKYDTYFYVSGNKLAEYVSKIVSEEIELIEYSLDEILQSRIIFIIYNKQSEFRQSNVGLVTGSEESNIGGVTKIVDNKVFVYYEGDHKKLRQQIKASIAEILINEMLYGGTFRDRVSSSALLNLPEWFTPGLISYIAYDTDYEMEGKIKAAIIEGKVQKIHRLIGEDAKIAGHAFWRYLSETYGDEIVSQIVYMTRISKSVESGFLYVLGMPLKDIVNDWFYYYQGRYEEEISNRVKTPVDAELFVKRSKKKFIYSQVKMSPNGKYIAYSTNQDGQYKIWLYDLSTQKTKRLVKKENKLEQIPDYSYPILAWHPNGEILTYVYERKGLIWLTYYTIETKDKLQKELFYLDKVLDYSFSHDGQQIVFSAVENGFTDIFTYSVIASTYKNITNDLADDLHPRFVDKSKQIIFSSNRDTNLLIRDKDIDQQLNPNFDLFIYDNEIENGKLTRLTNTWTVDEFKPSEYKKDKYFYLTNKNGILNRGFVKYDSTISYIDTAIHYRNYTNAYPISNRSFNIGDYDFNKLNREFADAVKGEKKYSLFTNAMNPKLRPDDDEFSNTWFREYTLEKNQMDSVLRMKDVEYKPDSIVIQELQFAFEDSLIDIDNYIFEIEKEAFLNAEKQKDEVSIFKLPKQLVYFTNFYSNLLVTQVDFGFMNQSYQAFTGSAFYFNPGFNVLTKAGAIDLFEDYKITGGIRFSIDFESNEYLLSVEDLKNRLDKQYVYHRQVFESLTQTEYSKIFSNELISVFKYPLSQIQAFNLTFSARLDEKVYKSLPNDPSTLYKATEHKYWGGLKGEYILDNTRGMGLNLYSGTRLKAFGEYYNQIGSGFNSHLFVVGADIRNYFPIHRDLVFASRIAYSSSFGNSLLIYYLGGVDNWMNFSRKTPTFDNSTNINQSKNWVYQAVATNMRGFIQNVRNGNSFAVANFELRWPIVRYLFNRPISNDFFNNFMLMGFTDVGSAWEGWNPAKANNAYDYQIKYQKPVTLIIDRKRSPFVAGVGFGLRSRFLGYYVRTDWAWGIDGGRMLPRVFYLSLTTDF
ncbi:MAG: PD40 domain-containing protein [Salinivirgaceae bacterium]|nr:PD40 domain-containing protein [Salinivirgaceae bacterium]